MRRPELGGGLGEVPLAGAPNYGATATSSQRLSRGRWRTPRAVHGTNSTSSCWTIRSRPERPISARSSADRPLRPGPDNPHARIGVCHGQPRQFSTARARSAARKSPNQGSWRSPPSAIVKLSATCICGSDLWPYRGLQDVNGPMHMGHEYCGDRRGGGQRGEEPSSPGQFVVGSFCISDNTCPHCQFGFQSSCVHREFMSGAQAPYARVPLADGTLVPTRDVPSNELIPQPPRDLRRVGDGLVRRRRRQRVSDRLDSRRRGRRRGRADGRPCGQGNAGLSGSSQ